LLNYNTAQPLSTDSAVPHRGQQPEWWISRYAWGDDYHDVLRERLDALVESLRERFKGTFEARSYVDTGPVQERVLANMPVWDGWGKTRCCSTRRTAPTFSRRYSHDSRSRTDAWGATSYRRRILCGSCRRCLDACPTQAFVEPYLMDARKCISYLTIELRGSIPEEIREPMETMFSGATSARTFAREPARPDCDDTAVPAKKFSPPKENHTETSLPPQDESLYLPRLEWLLGLSEADFRELFREAPSNAPNGAA